MTRVILARHDEGEALLFRMDGETNDAIVIALSPGAVEVAHSMASLTGRALVRLDPYELTCDAILAGVEGEAVVLVDDGLLHPAILVAAARAIRRGRPRRVVVAAPVLAAEIALLAGKGVVDRTIQGGGGASPYERLPFENEPPPTEAQALRLLDDVNRSDEGGWILDLLDIRLVSAAPPDARAFTLPSLTEDTPGPWVTYSLLH